MTPAQARGVRARDVPEARCRVVIEHMLNRWRVALDSGRVSSGELAMRLLLLVHLYALLPPHTMLAQSKSQPAKESCAQVLAHHNYEE